MRVLFITQDFPPDLGGIQTYSWEIGRRLSDRVDEAVIVAPQRPNDESVDRELASKVYRLKARPDLLPLAALWALPKIAWRHRVDVSFHAQWQTAGAALLSRRLTGFPRRIVVAAHGRELLFNPFGGGPAGRIYDRIRTSMMDGVDRFLPVSNYTASLLKNRLMIDRPAAVIHNGTDPDHFRPADGSAFRKRIGAGDRPLILFVGRLVERKGVATVIEALPRVLKAVPHAMLAVVGDGPDRPRLEQKVDEYHLRGHVHFTGTVPYDTLSEVYSAADVFVMPSTNEEPDVEGFGIVFLEANACGCPVIGARSGGIPDAIVDGETGLLVEPDDVDGLARAIARILTKSALRERMGDNGRKRILQELTWEHVTARVVAELRKE